MERQKFWSYFASAMIVLTGIVTFMLSHTLNKQYVYRELAFVFSGDKLLLWTHVFSNVLIGIAYMAIPLTLMSFVKKTGKKLPFQWVFLAFGVFIVACGLTHFVAAYTTWSAVYWLAQFINVTTVIVSIGTAIAIPSLVPKVAELIDASTLSESRKVELESKNKELLDINSQIQLEIEKSKKFQKELEQTQQALLNVLEEKKQAPKSKK